MKTTPLQVSFSRRKWYISCNRNLMSKRTRGMAVFLMLPQR
ncbi:hypothetical protein AVDCRST_MAG92-2851 [uncultured Coleofasciculus sp.]|uniref:Uncharacterized protein n=1 Tax=uncultured Coleofasciculus sp. TaxID=1267456 RepID=A0A6J4J2N7_9CYAN|nr:hypothetical protein AVDCRST_MAG92-2851 [uncultured Coleofasciculus sp.]